MSIRITAASIAAAVILGTGALVGGSIATSTSAEAGWHGRGHGHGHFGHSWRHPRPWGGHWGRPGWGYRPIGFGGGYYGGCFTVLKARFIPGLGYVERPVTRCR